MATLHRAGATWHQLPHQPHAGGGAGLCRHHLVRSRPDATWDCTPAVCDIGNGICRTGAPKKRGLSGPGRPRSGQALLHLHPAGRRLDHRRRRGGHTMGGAQIAAGTDLGRGRSCRQRLSRRRRSRCSCSRTTTRSTVNTMPAAPSTARAERAGPRRLQHRAARQGGRARRLGRADHLRHVRHARVQLAGGHDGPGRPGMRCVPDFDRLDSRRTGRR